MVAKGSRDWLVEEQCFVASLNLTGLFYSDILRKLARLAIELKFCLLAIKACLLN